MPGQNAPHLKHERLKQTLLDHLASGRLRPGQMLPPETELARQMGVSRNTVRQALGELESRQLIRRGRGRGTMVAEDAFDRLKPSSNLFGLVMPELNTGFYPSLQAGFHQAMRKTYGQMLASASEQDLYKQLDVLLQLADRPAAGIAVVPVSHTVTPAHQFRVIQQLKIPLVFCHRRVPGMSAPLVTFSGFDVGYKAGEELARRGHRRVALLVSHRGELTPQYHVGLAEAMHDGGGILPDEFVHYGKRFRPGALSRQREQEITNQLKQLFDHADPPTAIMASFDGYAETIHMILRKMGYSVPDDVSLISFGGKRGRESMAISGLKSVTVDEFELGRRAFDVLSEICDGKRALDDNDEILVPLEVSEGASVQPPHG